MAKQVILTECEAVNALGLNGGDIMVEFQYNDYGMKSDHEVMTGEAHVNVSADGDYPFYTLPRSAVEFL